MKDWLEENRIMILDWPANSPDLNPIENAWAMLKQKTKTKLRTESQDALWNTASSIWYHDMDPDYIKKLIRSMPDRIKEVIKAKGGHTRY